MTERAKLNRIVVVPVLLFIICLGYFGFSLMNDTLILDIDFRGGTQVVFESSSPISEEGIENALSGYDVDIRFGRSLSTNTLILTFDESIDSNDIISALKDADYEFESFSVQTVGSSLGSGFFQQASLALILAFILMAVVIFIIFKAPAVSFYTSLCPLFDIIETLAITQLLGIELSLAGFAALLMIVGYSVDDDVMIATRILKSNSEDMEGIIKGSFKTSVTTSSAVIVALFALFALSISNVFTQIAIFLIIGLFIDFFNTWVFNVNILKWHASKR